jgi:hypothetical protein
VLQLQVRCEAESAFREHAKRCAWWRWWSSADRGQPRDRGAWGSRVRQQQEAAPHIRAAAPAGAVAAPADGTAWTWRRSRRVASPQPEHPGCRVTSRALAADCDLGQRQCPSSRHSLWCPPRVPVRSRRRPGSPHPSLHLRKVSAANSTPLSMICFLSPAIGSI